MSTSTRPIRVLLATGSPHLLQAFGRLIAGDADLEVVARAASGSAAVSEVVRVAPDVAVLDFRLPDGKGPAIARRIAAQRPGTLVILLADEDGEEYQRAAYQAGASACIVKTAAFPSLPQAIKRLSLSPSA